MGDLTALVHNQCPKLPKIDQTGRVHGKIPKDLSKYSAEDLEELAGDLEESIIARQNEMHRLGWNPGHGKRLADEEQLLIRVWKFLSGS